MELPTLPTLTCKIYGGAPVPTKGEPCHQCGDPWSDHKCYSSDSAFTIRHCTEWCETVGIDDAYVPEMVRALADDGPDSHMSWPTVARSIGATFWDGTPYR